MGFSNLQKKAGALNLPTVGASSKVEETNNGERGLKFFGGFCMRNSLPSDHKTQSEDPTRSVYKTTATLEGCKPAGEELPCTTFANEALGGGEGVAAEAGEEREKGVLGVGIPG